MTGNRFSALCKPKKLKAMAEEYISFCRDSSDAAGKPRPRFPNIAGFCRYFNIKNEELQRLKKEHSEAYETLSLIFEDEALNFGASPTLLAAYLKRRLGYGERAESSATGIDGGEMRLIFEHDIEKDGI
jgi:hypothetical protein